jgi:hypothetical protein
LNNASEGQQYSDSFSRGQYPSEGGYEGSPLVSYDNAPPATHGGFWSGLQNGLRNWGQAGEPSQGPFDRNWGQVFNEGNGNSGQFQNRQFNNGQGTFGRTFSSLTSTPVFGAGGVPSLQREQITRSVTVTPTMQQSNFSTGFNNGLQQFGQWANSTIGSATNAVGSGLSSMGSGFSNGLSIVMPKINGHT